MIKRYLLIFLLILLVGILGFPQEIFAELQLSKRDSHYLLDSVQQGLIKGWIDITGSPDFSQPEKQAALFLIRNAIQKKELDYVLKELPKEGLESLVKIVISSYFLPDAGAILNKIEKETVKRAVEIATDWFLQNEIKVASGKLSYSFTSYKGNRQEPVFYYNLAHRRLNNDYEELAVEFYSPEEIEPKKPTGVVLGLGVSSWEFYTWRNKGNEKIEPFIVRIKGKVRKTSAGGYKWEKTLKIEVTFSEPIPELSELLEEESPITKIPIIGKYYRDWKNQIEKTKVLIEKLGITENIKDIGASLKDTAQDIKNSAEGIIGKIKSYLSQVNPFSPAALVQPSLPSSSPEPSPLLFTPADWEEIEDWEETEEQITTLEEKITEAGPREIEQELRSEVSLAEIQEKLDDITERIDVINQKVTELVGILPQEKSEEAVEITKIEEKPEEVEEESEIEEITEEDSEEMGQEELGQEEIGHVLCKKMSGSFPKRNKIIINEIAWMGTNNSANDEWIELKNISGGPVNLSGWQILDKDEQIKIILGENDIISANGYYLLERTDDSSVPNITADFIYTGVLNDKNEALYLFNENCGLEDEIIASSNWPAGDKSKRRTMERGDDLSWHTYYGSAWSGIFGTPKRKNSFRPLYSGGGGGGGASLPSEEPSEPSLPPKILITEVQIADGETFYDFIELYNPATTSLDISGFQLKKKSSSGKEYSIRVFPQGSTILAQDYFLWMNSDYASSTPISADATSTQTLAKNNSIALFDEDKNILDALAWGSSTGPFVETAPFSQNPGENQSLGRKWNQGYQDTNNNQEDFEVQEPTPRERNKSTSVPENQSPIALFNYIPQDPLVDQEIIFNAASSSDEDGDITSFVWDFGNSNSATTNQATTTYSYSTSSSYIVSLIVIDNDGATSSPATATIEVASPQPILEVEPSTLSFEAEENGENPESKTLTVQNIGEEDLDWIISINYATTSTSTDWLLVSSATGTTPTLASSTIEISVDISELESASYEAIITVEGLEGGSESVPVALIITAKPVPSLAVVINEIAWMGTKAEDNDEWIEFYNNTNEEINLEGWEIKAADGTPEISLTGTISSKSYFLLERTDDQTISDIKADQIYTGVLENEGEKLELRDAEDNLIDLIDCSLGWFAGRNQKIGENWVRMSMERVNPEISGDDSSNWITNSGFSILGQDSKGNLIQGTPGQQNSRYNFSETFLQNVSISQDMVWAKKGNPYVVKGTLTILENITLLIEPGVRIEFVFYGYGYPYRSRMEIEGTLKAIGKEGEPVIFTSDLEKTNTAGSGDWRCLHFTGPDSVLDNVIVKYGGFYRKYLLGPLVTEGAIFVEGTDITIKNSIIENNWVAGIWLSSSNSLVENTILRNHNRVYHYAPRRPGHGLTVAIYLEGSSNPTFHNLTFEENTIKIYPIPE